MDLTRRDVLAAALGGSLLTATRSMAQGAQPRSSGHVVLLGDSIFDNKRYVGRDPSVVDQLRGELPKGWKATLAAIDGNVTSDVTHQLEKIPRDASHLILSVGGNDALREKRILTRPASVASDVFLDLAAVRERFEQNYVAMLKKLLGYNKPTVVCTVYDPHYADRQEQRMAVAALAVFNDCISRAAVRHGLPILDLRLLMTEDADYANPIEPSAAGGMKIAKQIRRILLEHDFSQKRSVFYA